MHALFAPPVEARMMARPGIAHLDILAKLIVGFGSAG